MLLCPGVTQARCPVPGHSRNGSDSESLSPLIPRACTACIKRTPLFCTGFQPFREQPEGRGCTFFSQGTALGASHAFAALQFGSPMRSRAGAGTAATARAAGCHRDSSAAAVPRAGAGAGAGARARPAGAAAGAAFWRRRGRGTARPPAEHKG